MTSSALALMVALTATSQYVTYQRPVTYYAGGGAIQKQEMEDQESAFESLWGEDLVTTLGDLPVEGKVPEWRTPYSGHDYPDKVGGTLGAMAKYDQAFNRGYSRAYLAEREDLAFHATVKKPGREVVRRGMFGRVISVSSGPGVVPTWYGHCNGWTAASIRHAEPQKAVVRNGVTITPADIKGMLAELYMYSQTQFLGGVDDAINPGTLHLALTNWIGRKSHPIGMETALGEPVINFPIHAYRATVTKLSPRRYDVRMLITYTVHIAREVDKGPKAHRNLYFHYVLDLDANGEIVAGQYYGDSARIDMVWTPLQPVQGGEEGNRGGNPHLDVKEIMAIYRESVDPEILKKWVNVDPTDDERKLANLDLPDPHKKKEDKPAEEDPAAAPATTDATATPAPGTPAANTTAATPAALPAPTNLNPPPAPATETAPAAVAE